MDDSLRGKTVVITGAASGIGRATSLAFAQEGAHVVVADVAAEEGEETVRLIQNGGGSAVFVKADVRRTGEVEGMIEQVVAAHDRLDCAVNNAGITGRWARTGDVAEEEWQNIMAVNLTGVFTCMRFELRQMVQQGNGAIVNVSSVAGLRGLANSSAYSASKHGIIGLTKSAALEYARSNIRINAVCPVFTKTPMLEELLAINPSYEARLRRNIPMRRFGAPEEVARTIVWLCSESASYLTGLALPVDGGITAG